VRALDELRNAMNGLRSATEPEVSRRQHREDPHRGCRLASQRKDLRRLHSRVAWAWCRRRKDRCFGRELGENWTSKQAFEGRFQKGMNFFGKVWAGVQF
jgi:hypothetical protein